MADPRRAFRRTAQPLIWLALVFVWPGPSILRQSRRPPEAEPEPHLQQVVDPSTETGDTAAPRDWLTAIEPSCNWEEVMLATDLHPAPTTGDGPALEAACFAIAGDIAKARALVLAMEPGKRPDAAGVILGVALDARDARTDLSVGPVMDLVLEFWPNHDLALYHAGRSRYLSGHVEEAAPFLEQFLLGHRPNDTLALEARRMLEGGPEP